jgi:3-phosphoshikimate 1-carboxyvinyltransferase
VNYLKNGTLLPIYNNDPNDIKVVYNALKTISETPKTPVACVIDVEDCGAAYRFLMAVLATTQGKWLLTGTPRLLERPILPLVNFLNNNGANIQKIDLGWLIEGAKLQIEDCDIESSETSQYASAIMMIGQKGEEGESQISNLKSQISNPYLKLIATILRTQNLSTLLTLADWSAAAFWIANALLTSDAHYLLKDLHFDGLQGDAEMVQWFQKWGLTFTETKSGIEVKHDCLKNRQLLAAKGAKLRGKPTMTNKERKVEIPPQNIDVTNTPDIAMILATLAVCYPFELTLSGVKNLNLKESNRLDILVHELSKFTHIETHTQDCITIYKRTQPLPKQFHFNSYNDHRFVMAWSLLKNYGTVTIENADCVKKSYPEFRITESL